MYQNITEDRSGSKELKNATEAMKQFIVFETLITLVMHQGFFILVIP